MHDQDVSRAIRFRILINLVNSTCRKSKDNRSTKFGNIIETNVKNHLMQTMISVSYNMYALYVSGA